METSTSSSSSSSSSSPSTTSSSPSSSPSPSSSSLSNDPLASPDSLFRVQIMSDLHLEFPGTPEVLPKFERRAPYLALLGDIGQVGRPSYERFLVQQAAIFEKVFVVTGNHEYYGSSRKQVNEATRRLCAKHTNLEFLMMDSYLINDPSSSTNDEDQEGSKKNVKGKKSGGPKNVRILGTTLWHNAPEKRHHDLAQTMTDYDIILADDPPTTDSGSSVPRPRRKITPTDTNAWHAEELAWLQEQLKAAEKAGEIAVVFTHHLPTHVLRGSGYGFSTDLHHLFASPLRLWCYGHSHCSDNRLVSGVRIVSNQLGYITWGEKTGFCPEFVISLQRDGSTKVWEHDPRAEERRAAAAAEAAAAKNAAAAAGPPPAAPPPPTMKPTARPKTRSLPSPQQSTFG